VAGDPNKLPVLELVSDQMRAVVAKSAELAAGAYSTDQDLDQIRAAYRQERGYWNQGGPRMAATDTAEIATPRGAVTVRIHRPTAAASLPAVAYFHGGGFVLGDLDTHDRIMRALAAESGAAVVGVDYSLAPEAKFPIALEQSAAVVDHLARRGGEFGLDGARLALAGDSGGAQLALAAWLKSHDAARPAPSVRALALYYGLYGLRDSASRRLLGGPWDGLTEADLRYYADCYLADPADALSPYVDCLSADLAAAPPCYVAAAEFDPLLDDSAALAAILDRHGVEHVFRTFPGVLHAFLHNARLLDAAAEALAEGGAFLRAHLN
jgi:acetyl esterase